MVERRLQVAGAAAVAARSAPKRKIVGKPPHSSSSAFAHWAGPFGSAGEQCEERRGRGLDLRGIARRWASGPRPGSCCRPGPAGCISGALPAAHLTTMASTATEPGPRLMMLMRRRQSSRRHAGSSSSSRKRPLPKSDAASTRCQEERWPSRSISRRFRPPGVSWMTTKELPASTTWWPLAVKPVRCARVVWGDG